MGETVIKTRVQILREEGEEIGKEIGIYYLCESKLTYMVTINNYPTGPKPESMRVLNYIPGTVKQYPTKLVSIMPVAHNVNSFIPMIIF